MWLASIEVDLLLAGALPSGANENMCSYEQTETTRRSNASGGGRAPLGGLLGRGDRATTRRLQADCVLSPADAGSSGIRGVCGRYDWDAIRAYYADGHSMTQCMRVFGFSRNA